MSSPMPNQSRPGHPVRISSPRGQDIRYGETVTTVDQAGNILDERRPVYVDANGQPTNGPQPGGYTLPPGVLHQAAREAAQGEKPNDVDQLNEDAEAAQQRPDFPDGSPEMIPFYRLSFKRRADALRMFARLEKMQSVDLKPGESPSVEQAAIMFERLATLDDFLATVAKDPDEYRVWVEGPGADTEVFGKFWAAYQARFQPGEAERSSS